MTTWGHADLEALYERLERPLYNVVYRTLWDREEARDVVQDTFVRLWDRRRAIRPATVEALAYRVALNLARSRLRRRRVRRWLSLDALAAAPPAPTDLERAALDDERAVRLRDAIAALPDDLRAVVLLTGFTTLRHDQIGAALGVPAGTVGSRRHRALRALRERLGEAFAMPERRAAGDGAGS